MIGEIISGISSLVVGWFSVKKEEQKTKSAIEVNKQQLAISKTEYNAEWEMAALANSDKWMKRLSYAMFASPLVVAVFAPDWVYYYFQHAITKVPDWWVKTFVSINGSVWGISALKNSITGIIGQIRK